MACHTYRFCVVFVVISLFYLPLFGCRQTETTVSQYSWSLLSQRDGFGDNWKKKRTTTDEEKETNTHGVFSVLTPLFQFLNIYSRPPSNVSEHISVGSPAFWLTQSQISLCKIKASNYVTYILRGHVRSKDTTRHCSLKQPTKISPTHVHPSTGALETHLNQVCQQLKPLIYTAKWAWNHIYLHF